MRPCRNVQDELHVADPEAFPKTSRQAFRLSDEDQLWPEQSTSAIVCHHPSAKYFTL